MEPPKNTERGTKTSNNTWKSCHWCQNTGETRKIEEIPKEELNELLKHFYWELRRMNGEDFEPGRLRTIQRGLDRHLLRNEVGFSIIRVFEASKLKALKNIEKLWQTVVLGVHMFYLYL